MISTIWNQRDPAQRLALFSELVLDLYRLARERSLTDFQGAVLERLAPLIGFDKAWWGRSALVDGHVREHSGHLFGLPGSFMVDWRAIEDDDVTVVRAHEEPGRTVIVDLMGTTSGLKWLGRRHHIGELLCVIHSHSRTGLSDHLSLYRPPGAPRFGASECELLDALIRHLSAALDANQIRTLVSHREHLGQQQHLALAVCDHHGVLHGAEPGFATLLDREWPDWRGARLPKEVIPEDGYSGRGLRIESSAVKDLFLLAVRARSPLDSLSERELGVASLFGQGRTYKEIARELEIAPSTVRHHIRGIYQKLEVHDKASVASLVHQSAEGVRRTADVHHDEQQKRNNHEHTTFFPDDQRWCADGGHRCLRRYCAGGADGGAGAGRATGFRARANR